MKYLIFILAMFTAASGSAQLLGNPGSFFGLVGGSPNVYYDSALHMPYVGITPVRWQWNLHEGDRLYAKISWINSDSTAAVVTWRICYQELACIDCVGMGNYDLNAAECGEIRLNDDMWLFEWLADSSRLILEIE